MKTSSISQKVTVAVFVVIILFLLQFVGVYLSSQRFQSGMSELHQQQQLSDSLTQLHQITDSLVEIPGSAGKSDQESERLFDAEFSQTTLKLRQAQGLAEPYAEFSDELKRSSDALDQLNRAARRYFRFAPSADADRELLLAKQFGLDVTESLEKLKLVIQERSNKLFNGLYRTRYLPFVVTIILTLFFIAFALAGGLRFRRQLVASIDNLVNATREVARGSLDVKASILSLDEIGMLTNSFNSMVHELQRSTVSREYVEAIIQSLPDALFVLSPAGEIQQVNRAATRRTGHELKALLNQPVSALFKPANMDFRREFRDVETGLLSGSGDVIPVSVSTSAIRGKNGRLSGIACVVTDLSERTRLYHEAQEAIRSRDEFLSIASHEVKTPLTSLSLQLQILGREIRKNLDTARRESPGREPDHVSIPTRMLRIVSSSETQSEKLSNLLDELLDLTRIRLGRLTLARESFDLAHVAREVVERFKVEATQKRIPIWVDAPEPVIGQWDQLRIEQVISNLVSNAMKYGNGKPISVKVQMLEGGDQARLVVADQGMGIPAEMRERIFERFERAGVSGRKIAGLGLGLYICRQIVEAHGGSIRVETGPGPGSSFSVHLPLAEAAERVLKKASDG